jgi:hypothetical protein
MTRTTQRQLMDAMNRAVERAGRASDERYGLKGSKHRAKSKPKRVSKAQRKPKAAAE